MASVVLAVGVINIMKKTSLLLIVLLMTQLGVAKERYAYHVMKYIEGDDRVEVIDQSLAIETEIDDNNELFINAGYDTISGASPTYKARTPVYTQLDAKKRLNNVQLAQALSPHVILNYDPNTDYGVEKIKLEDNRTSASLSWLYRDQTRDEWRAGFAYSKEEDYTSHTVNFSHLSWQDERKNRSYVIAGALTFNETTAFKTAYLDKAQKSNVAAEMQLSLNQVFTPNAYINSSVFLNYATGYLDNHYQTVLRAIDVNKDASFSKQELFLATETRPDKRLGGGVSILYSQRWNDYVSQKLRYRGYLDDWGIGSHTIDAGLNLSVTSRFSVLLDYRFYRQNAAKFYQDAKSNLAWFGAKQLATNDERLGQFSAQNIELGAQWNLYQNWYINLSGSHYKQTNGFSANWYVFGVSYKSL